MPHGLVEGGGLGAVCTRVASERRGGGPPVPPGQDPQPLHETGRLRVLHVDNFAVIGSSRETCEELLVAMEDRFAEAGIAVAREEAAKADGILVGYQHKTASGQWKPTAKRYW